VSSVDVKDLKTYQQVYIYIIPIITNLGFINIVVIAVRLMWFEQRFKAAGVSVPCGVDAIGPDADTLTAASFPRSNLTQDVEAQVESTETESPEKTSGEAEP
jgi:hypothetical protein